MQPLVGDAARELARAAKEIRGIFTDIDDTLTMHGVLVPEAYQAIVDAHRAGLRIVPVTGRPAGFAEVLALMWPVDAVIAENGALAVRVERDADQGGRPRVTRWYWEQESDRAAQAAKLESIKQTILRELPFTRLAEDQRLRATDVAFDIGEGQTLDEARIAELEARLRALGACVTRSTVHMHASLAANPADVCDKAKMLIRLAGELWGESTQDAENQYLFVGDSPNDQAGFARFHNTVGVANVRRFADRLTPPPRFVTSAPGGAGFAEVVALLLSTRTAR
jgi:HAD superfamily hydrolase (TIGR01484 family)